MQNASYDCFIGGQWLAARGREYLDVHDPASGELLSRIARGGKDDVNDAVDAAQRALGAWASCPPVQRVRVLSEIGRRILAEKDRLAHIESRDTGKPLRQAMVDVVVAARFFDYYSGLADKVLGSSIPLGAEYHDFTVREPLGVTAQIVPWNFPLQLTARGLAPALATGNAVVIKPAELACLSVLELARICHEAGLPPGVLNVVPGYGTEAGAALVSHRAVNLVVFTGSVATGVNVMKAAAENVVPVLLELGGKSPNIVLADAPLDTVLPAVLRAAYPNSGQTCAAGTRVLVHRSIHRRFTDALADLNRKLSVGPGLRDPDIGPMISRAQQSKVQEYIRLGRDEGAEVIEGGSLLDDADAQAGNYVLPTIVDRTSPAMSVHREEIFGPVLAVTPFDDIEEAAKLANDTEYGLVTGIWGNDLAATHWLANQVKAGQIYVNCYGAGTGVELPFGGYKKSGFGREKGLEALLAYTQVKNICFHIPPLRGSGT